MRCRLTTGRGALLAPLALLALASVGCPAPPGADERVRAGPDVRADLVVVYRPEADSEAVGAVPTTVLMEPDPRGGYRVRWGIHQMANGYVLQGHRVMTITFHPGTAIAVRDTVRAVLARLPIVLGVHADTIPSALVLSPARVPPAGAR